ncbi:hypothetical protein ICN46_09740 [Polynucleobacter sp. Latsch14-2]|uniref:hypothetical protein n=1 Tax=Polynucleobacter sp. Latsch14-2 TaxID=2576920 RepID=UPI001C0AFE87|nr:hypothetical protein [Polynucleobacter sp. Latsch14-2]MBU3615178.1 hypothetical protein [Polynucleobacter sp. Latsch14-2]
MSKQEITKTIVSSIKSLNADDARAWTKIALIVLQVEENNFWEASHRSFTEWLVSFGQSIGLKEGSIWRYYRAGKYYQELQPLLSKNQITNPLLNELPTKVSPENIEILGKLERVMPNDIFIKLAAQVISATITRDSLRQTWLIYRPILEGRTARGMGMPIPRVDLKDKAQHDSLLEAHVFTALSQSAGSWLKTPKPFHFELLRGEVARLAISESKFYYIDAIAIVQMNVDGPIELHGIEIKSNNSPVTKYDTLKKVSSYFDFVWVTFHDYDPKVGAKQIPSEFGLLEFKGQKIDIIKAAKRNETSAEAQLSFVKNLLIKFMRK